MMDITNQTIPLLSLVTFLPLVGAAAVLLCGAGNRDRADSNIRNVAFMTSFATFMLSLLIWQRFDASNPGFQLVENRSWFPEFGISYSMGVDGISLFFVLLATFLTPLCILASWHSIKHRVREYMAAFLVLESLMIGMFCALDVVLFYIFFEAVLIPMFLIIGIWGGQRRIYAAYKFFLYTLAGSLLMLIAVLVLYQYAETMYIPMLLETVFVPPAVQFWLFLAFFAAFAVKVPMFPFHTWLPDAHVEAPTAGSVILAGVLLKMGAYGFIRFSIPMLPHATEFFAPYIFGLSVIAVIYTSLIALVQEDMKKLIAYSSVAHMGFVTIGLFTLNQQAMQGAVFQMLSHGIVSGALFLCVGVLYDRMHTREIARYGGVASVIPKFSVLFLLFTMATIGLPGTSGFVGEFLVLLGAYQVNTYVAFFAATGVILGAAYSLLLYRRIAYGKVVHQEVQTLKDLTLREKIIFAPLVLLVLWMGIYPSSFLKPMEPAIASLIHRYDTAILPPPDLQLAQELEQENTTSKALLAVDAETNGKAKPAASLENSLDTINLSADSQQEGQ